MKKICRRARLALLIVSLNASFALADQPNILWMRGGTTSVIAMTYAAAGTELVTASWGDEDSIKVWRVSDGVLLRTISLPGEDLYGGISVTPDGQYAAVPINPSETSSLSASGWSVELVRLSDSTILNTVALTGAFVNFQLSPDATLLAVGTPAGPLNVYSLATPGGAIVNSIPNTTTNGTACFGCPLYPLAFQGDDSIVAYGQSNGNIVIYTVGTYSSALTEVTPAETLFLGSSPNNEWIAATNIYTVGIFPPGGCGSALLKTGCPVIANAITVVDNSFGAFSPDSSLFAFWWNSSTTTATLDLFSTNGWSNAGSVTVGAPSSYSGSLGPIAFSPDSSQLADSYTGNNGNGVLELRSTANVPTVTEPISQFAQAVGGIAFSNDNPTSMFATVGEDGGPTFVKIWNASTGALLETIQDSCGDHTPPCSANGTTVAFSPDNSKILVGGFGGVNQYNVSDGSLVNNLVPAPASGQRLATYSPDGSQVAVPGVSLYSSNGPLLATASLQATAGGYVSFLNIPVVFSPSGSSLFAAFYDEYGEICPTYGVQQLSTAGASLSPVSKPAIASFCNSLLGSYGINTIGISPDGTLLAVGTSTEGRVLVFSASSGSLLATLVGSTGRIESIAFSADGQTLAATDSSANICIWSLGAGTFGTLLQTYNQETGNEPLSAIGYGYPLADVVYSPDGTKIGYARYDSVAVVAANPYPPTSSTVTTASPATVTFSPTSQSVMLTATVTSTGGNVNSGTVTFTVVGVGVSVTSGTVSGGAASVLFTVPGGTLATTYTIQAAYGGATGFTSSGDTTKTLTVQQATPVLTWGVPAAITYGGALSAVQLDATAAIPGSFVYTPPAGTVLPVGANQPLSVAFTPSDSTDYTAASTSTTISVNPAAPPSSPANLVVTHVLTRIVIASESGGSNDVAVRLTFANTGGTTASHVQLSSVKVGSYSATPLCADEPAALCPGLPLDLGTIGAGASVQLTVAVPGVVGASGAASSLTISGTYSGGTFNSSSRITLP